MPSHRGGASAPASCKSALGTCMTRVVRGGQSMRVAGKTCMKTFNSCRTGGRKSRKTSRKTHRRGKRR